MEAGDAAHLLERRDDANVAAALAEVGRIAGFLKVLGSYPMAVL